MQEYGKNYDVNSLNRSLRFTIDDTLRPSLSYEAKDFTLKSDFDKEKRAFNQNARIEGSFNRLMDFNELDAMEEMEFYGLDFDMDNPYDYAVEEMDNIDDDIQVFRRSKIIEEPKEVYKEAETATMSNFLVQYEKVLKPLFYKKYGIML